MATRLLSPEQAVAELVPEHGIVGVGGMHTTAAPMALVRELVRRRVPVGRLVTSPSTSLQADLPIGAGLVDELVSPYVGFEDLGLAPCFRRAAEEGSLRIVECDEGGLTHALYAGSGGIPFIPLPAGIERTDIPAASPELYRETKDPFTGETRWAIQAIRPDVALIACREADERGQRRLRPHPVHRSPARARRAQPRSSRSSASSRRPRSPPTPPARPCRPSSSRPSSWRRAAAGPRRFPASTTATRRS